MKKIMIAAAAASVMVAGAAGATTVSPTSKGALPAAVSVVGGIVADIVGTNGTRVVTQTAASSLFEGFASSNPLAIGTQTGFNAAVTNQLGGGISELSIRITLDDGDSGVNDFDEDENELLLNGVAIGNFSDVVTQRTDSTGTAIGGTSLGFRNDILDTGFFYTNDATVLASIFASLVSTEELSFELDDVDSGDNYFDFTQGIDSSLVNVGTGPVVTPPPSNVVPLPAAGWLLIAGVGGLTAAGRRKKKA